MSSKGEMKTSLRLMTWIGHCQPSRGVAAEWCGGCGRPRQPAATRSSRSDTTIFGQHAGMKMDACSGDGVLGRAAANDWRVWCVGRAQSARTFSCLMCLSSLSSLYVRFASTGVEKGFMIFLIAVLEPVSWSLAELRRAVVNGPSFEHGTMAHHTRPNAPAWVGTTM